LHPASPVLDNLRTTFRLQWRAAPVWGVMMGFPELSRFRVCTRFFVAESVLAQSTGDSGTAMERRLDAMELAGKIPRGGTVIHALVGYACQEMAFASCLHLAPRLPAGTVPLALRRVRRIQASWPRLPEVLEDQRLRTYDELATIARAYQQPTPLATVEYAWSLAGNGTVGDWARWLTPKRMAWEHIDRYYRQVINERRKPYGQRRLVPAPHDAVSRYLAESPGEIDWLEAKSRRVQSELSSLETALDLRAHPTETKR
jgi:hypothetical protein